MENDKVKYCKYCGAKVAYEAVVCVSCGRQIEMLSTNGNQTVVVNNTNKVIVGGRRCNKWVAFVLCLLFGILGIHKFYEGKIGMGILYLITGGLCGIGWIIDAIVILFNPNPYYV